MNQRELVMMVERRCPPTWVTKTDVVHLVGVVGLILIGRRGFEKQKTPA